MIREAPPWFSDELERVGGTNRYGDPIFKLVWTEEPKTVIGGRFLDGFVGYRKIRAIPGDACWALMIWEAPETFGTPEEWDYRYRQPDNGCLDIGSFPKHGRYRLLKQLMHRDIVQQAKSKVVYNAIKGAFEMIRVQGREMVTYKMEPCGLILDLMVPMLAAWRKLSLAKKIEATMEKKARQEKRSSAAIKDALSDSRIRRSSKLVQERAELIEKSMDKAMFIASRYGRGMVTKV